MKKTVEPPSVRRPPVDVIIIGAGIIGNACAFELAKKGYKTLNIDKLPAAGYGSTSSSSAVIRTHYSTWDGITIAFESIQHWLDWENYLEVHDESGTAQFIQSGGLVIGDESIKTLQLLKEVGVDYEIWDMPTMKKNIPIYDDLDYSPPQWPESYDFEIPVKKLKPVIYTPSTGYVNDPQLAAHNLKCAAESKGGQFLFNTEITQIRQKSGKVVGVTLKNGEKIDAPIVLNAGGPHSCIINRMAGVDEEMNITTKPLLHEVFVIPAPSEFNFTENGLVTIDLTTYAYHKPEQGNQLLMGTADPQCDPKVWVKDPDHFRREVTDDRWNTCMIRIAKRIPSLLFPRKPSGLADLYDATDDWIPIYDKSALDGFYMAVGTSGNQFKNAPMAGYLMAELIDACENGVDHDVTPVKVKCRYKDYILNAGFYSRLRKINTESSFTVLG